MAHAINVAKDVPQIDRIYVSTDSAEIASVAREFGAHVIERPLDLATDQAPEWLAWQHAVHYVRASGVVFDKMISLPATSPLRNAQDVVACLDALGEGVDGVITVTPSGRSPYFNMVTRSDDGAIAGLFPEKAYTRRQDAPIAYDITTVAYAANPDFVLQSKSLYDGVIRSVIVPRERAVDIDDKFDFIFAKALFEHENL